jgi:hypothetical protein
MDKDQERQYLLLVELMKEGGSMEIWMNFGGGVRKRSRKARTDKDPGIRTIKVVAANTRNIETLSIFRSINLWINQSPGDKEFTLKEEMATATTTKREDGAVRWSRRRRVEGRSKVSMVGCEAWELGVC